MKGKLIFKIKVKEDNDELNRLCMMRDSKIISDSETITKCPTCKHKRYVRSNERIDYERYYFYLDNKEKVEAALGELIIFPSEHFRREVGDLFVKNKADTCANCREEKPLVFGTNICKECRAKIFAGD